MGIPHALLEARVEDLERRLIEMRTELDSIKEMLVERPEEETT